MKTFPYTAFRFDFVLEQHKVQKVAQLIHQLNLIEGIDFQIHMSKSGWETYINFASADDAFAFAELYPEYANTNRHQS